VSAGFELFSTIHDNFQAQVFWLAGSLLFNILIFNPIKISFHLRSGTHSRNDPEYAVSFQIKNMDLIFSDRIF